MLSRLPNWHAVSHFLSRNVRAILVRVYMVNTDIGRSMSQISIFADYGASTQELPLNTLRDPRLNSSHIRRSVVFENTYYGACLRTLQFRHAFTSIR